MKRPITNLVMGCLAFLAFQLSAQTTTFTISPTTVTAAAGTQFTVDVTVDDFDDIVSFQYSNNWDPAILDFVEVTNITADLPLFTISNFGTTGAANGELSLSWFDGTVMGVTLDPGTVLYSLTFEAISATGTDIIFSGDPTSIEIINVNSEEVMMNALNSAVNGGGSNPPPPPPAGDLTIIGSDETAAAGTNVCLAVTANDFTDLVSMQYSMHWDETILDYTGVQAFGLPGMTVASFGATATANGDLTVSWFDNTAQGVTLTNGSTLFEVCFDVIGSSGDVSTFTFDGTPTNIEVINEASEEVTPVFDAGSVTVDGGTPPPPPPSGDLTIIGSDETAAAGTNVCVAVTANDFTDLVSMQYSMHWDETILDYTGVQAFGLPGMTVASFGATATANGDLTVSWFDNTAQGVTLTNGSTLFEVCFDVIGSSGDVSTFTFDGTPTNIEVINEASEEVTPVFDAGSVTVDGGTPPPPPPSGDFTIIGSDETAAAGANVCLAVTANNFDDIVSMQYSMHWDENILDYTGVQAFGLPDLTSASFGTTGAANGDLTVSWFDNTAQGVTLTNGSTLFEVCFDVIGSSGDVSTFTFDGTPTSVEIINEASMEITPVFDAGSVTVDGGTPPPPPSGDFTIIGSDETAAAGTNVCLAVTANNFDDIVSMQYSMHWDENILDYTGVQAFGLPDLTSASFGTTGAANGDLTVSWFDNTAQGVTLSNGSTLFEVCFDVIGSNGDVSTFTFDGTPTSVEIINEASMEITPVFDAGSVTVDGGTPPPPPTNGFAVIASDETMESGDAFCVEISVNDFEDIVSMQYTMEWDETLFEYTGVQSFGLPDLTVASFGATQTNDGFLTVSWFDNTALGITLDDGDVIYEVCFEAIGANNCGGTSEFEFNGSQTSVEIINAMSQEVPFQGIPGELTICDNVIPTNPLTFTAGEVMAEVGGTVCVPVTVDDADCITSVQFSMHFDETILEYSTLQNFGFPDMSIPGNFNVGDVGNGNITFSWFDQTTTGIMPGDGTVVFEICFEVIGDNGDVSAITFDGNPTIIEAINCSSQELDVEFNNGSVTVEDAAPCDGPVVITNEIINNVLCFGGATGSIDISVGGGNNAYTYVWENSSGQQISTDEDIFGQSAGEYCVTVTSCSGTETTNACYTINQPASEMTVTGVVMNPACFGDNTGSIDVTVTGGTTMGTGCFNYTYAWSDVGSTAQDRFGIGAGVYTVTVTDCNGCQQIENFNVVGSPSELTVTAISSPVTCAGDDDGTVTATANGGAAPYDYKLEGSTSIDWQTSNVFNGVAAGSVFVMVRDNFGCVKTTTIMVGTPNPISPTAIVVNDSDNCNGAIDLSVSGGMGGYSYSWTGPGSFSSSNQDLNNLCPGEYCVTITDGNLCTREYCQTVIAPLTADPTNPASVEPACFETCDGEITLNFNGGIPPFSYDWSTGSPSDAQAPLFTDLCSGSYTVTVTSNDGQSITISANVGEASQAVTVSVQDVDCVSAPTECDGEILVGTNGGFGGYTYQWTPGTGVGLNTNNPTSLCLNEYTVTVTDVEGCTATMDAEVEYCPTLLNMTLNSNPICNGGQEGVLNISVTGGLAPYDYVFDGPTPISSMNDQPGNITVENLLPGTYSVTVTDDAGGTFTQMDIETETIDEVELILSEVTVYPVDNAPANNNGKIEISVEGGAIPYDFQWSNGSTAQNPSNLEPGCFDLTVSDDNGCDEVFEVCVEEFEATASATQPDCPDEMGSITATSTGSLNAPFTYEWTDEGGLPVGTNDPTLANVPVGTYNLTITDTLGRSVDLVYELNSVSNLSATLEVNTNFNGFEIRCHGEASGSATVTPALGMEPYSIQWSNASTQATAVGLPAGEISVIVTDDAGCNFEMAVTLNEPPALSVTTASDRENCGENTGTAAAVVEGGVWPYDYNWDDDLMQTSQTAILLEGGLYTVTVVDDNGCDASAPADVPVYTPLVLQAISEPDEGGPSGKAIASVVGGTWPYEFQWNDFLETDSVLTELLPGKYIVKVSDAAGCEDFLTVEVYDGTICLDVLTVITPEGDGFNEEFRIGCLNRYNDNELQIFNRWGQLVFTRENYSDSDLWRGTNQRGNDVPDGVYFYVFDYLDPVTNTRETKKGSVTVLRK